MTAFKLLDEYLEAKQKLHDYFGYVSDWKEIPMDDARDYFWSLEQNDNGSGSVHYAETKEELMSQEGNCYFDTIYTQRFLPKFVYRAKDFTMISCNPHVDGNYFLRIFDNSKEIKILPSKVKP